VRRQARLTGVERYLAPTEHVLYICRRHPIVIAKPVGIWLLAMLVGAAVGFVTSPDSSGTLIDRIAGWAVIAVTFWAAWRLALWWVARYVLTDQRVLYVEGLVSRKVSAIPLAKVTDTTYRRTIPGRILGYGDLLLDSPGERPGLSVLTELPRPDELYRLVMSLVVRKDAGFEFPPAGPPPAPREDKDQTGPLPAVRDDARSE
jgi:hypothetical protein